MGAFDLEALKGGAALPGSSLVAGRYALVREVGSGGMGTVYQAVDRQSGEQVALKTLRRDRSLMEQEEERFEREASLLSLLSHPSVVRYLGNGITPEGTRYIVMEWVEGRSLQHRLAEGRPSVAESVTVVRAVAEALGEAHRLGVVHRDIKPGNILLQGGPAERLKLIDFGLARRLGSTAITATGTLLGSPGYMAPEQATCERVIGPPADVFALGCILYECLTGRQAFTGQHAMAIAAKILLDEPPAVARFAPDVPAALCALVARMMAKDPARRPSDGAAVAAELATLGDLRDVELWSAGGACRDVPEPLADADQALHVIFASGSGDEPTDLTHTALLRLRGVLREVAAPFGARVEVLTDGEVIAALPAGDVEEAAQAARCALALRPHLPEMAMVLVRRRGMLPDPDPVRVGDDSGLDDAVRELTVASMTLLFASALDLPEETGVRLDEDTAKLVASRFEIRRTPQGLYLAGGRVGPPGSGEPKDERRG
jgi:predicted Ser/Thr protein kinase